MKETKTRSLKPLTPGVTQQEPPGVGTCGECRLRGLHSCIEAHQVLQSALPGCPVVVRSWSVVTLR